MVPPVSHKNQCQCAGLVSLFERTETREPDEIPGRLLHPIPEHHRTGSTHGNPWQYSPRRHRDAHVKIQKSDPSDWFELRCCNRRTCPDTIPKRCRSCRTGPTRWPSSCVRVGCRSLGFCSSETVCFPNTMPPRQACCCLHIYNPCSCCRHERQTPIRLLLAGGNAYPSSRSVC